MIEKLCYNATVVVNGEEAVDAFERYPYDIIFMDVQMPMMDGLEAAKTIRKTSSYSNIPLIVAVTAHELKGNRQKYLENDMDEYLSKPISLENVSKIIEEFLDKKSN
jgi:CheY-like chemotaxis protein